MITVSSSFVIFIDESAVDDSFMSRLSNTRRLVSGSLMPGAGSKKEKKEERQAAISRSTVEPQERKTEDNREGSSHENETPDEELPGTDRGSGAGSPACF